MGGTLARAVAGAVAPGALLSLFLLVAACGLGRGAPGEDVTTRSIEAVQEAHTAEWMRLPGVVGTGIGRCEEEDCIRVFLARPSSEAEQEIPERVEGYRVELVVTGAMRTRPDSASGA